MSLRKSPSTAPCTTPPVTAFERVKARALRRGKDTSHAELTGHDLEQMVWEAARRRAANARSRSGT